MGIYRSSKKLKQWEHGSGAVIKWVGHLWLKRLKAIWTVMAISIGQLQLRGVLLFCGKGEDVLKNTGLQDSSRLDHRMTMGFGSFKLPTHRLLQKWWDHSLPTKLLHVYHCQQSILVEFNIH